MFFLIGSHTWFDHMMYTRFRIYIFFCFWQPASGRFFQNLQFEPEVEAMKKNSNFFQLFLKKWWKTYSNTYQDNHRVFKYQGLRIWHRHVHTIITFSYRDHFTFPTFKTLACEEDEKCVCVQSSPETIIVFFAENFENIFWDSIYECILCIFESFDHEL